MPSEGFLQIEAAKRRLAAAERLRASARAAEDAARKNSEDVEAEVNAARDALLAAEERWEVVDVDSVCSVDHDVHCGGNNGNKRRKLESGEHRDPSADGAAARDVDARWKAQGCFVYEITAADGIVVRSRPTLSDDAARTSDGFDLHDLVSVDLVRPSRFADSPSGPYLRCSDDSGWIFRRKYGAEVARPVPVEAGLWTFFVDYRGATLRCHPYPGKRLCVGSSVNLRPMQLVHCDRRVVSPRHGVASYRVQGTDGWVFEKDEHGTVVLLPGDTVKVGTFAYEVVGGDFPLCKEPSTFLKTHPHVTFLKGDAVVCDMIRQSPYDPMDGPFLRLSDGWGWMYEKMRESNCKMRQLPLEKGKWTLKVMNSPDGITMRRHPVVLGARTSITFQPGERIECDMRVKPSGPATFYRVAGKDGWVFDRSGDDTVLELISPEVSSSEGGWSIGFVRGIALAFQLTPAAADASTGVVAFKNSSNTCINIFYTTRNVRIDYAGGAQSWRRDCSDDELRNIMQNPGRHAVNDGREISDARSEEEKSHREKLIELEKEEEENAKKKISIMNSLRETEAARDEAAARMEQKIAAREKELAQQEEERRREKEEAERLDRERVEREKEEAERLERERVEKLEREKDDEQRRRRTCRFCKRLFVNEHARAQHVSAVHKRRR